MNWAMVFERNWFFIKALKAAGEEAKSLQQFPTLTNDTDTDMANLPVVLGVFGAGHVYGIVEQWYQLCFSLEVF